MSDRGYGNGSGSFVETRYMSLSASQRLWRPSRTVRLCRLISKNKPLFTCQIWIGCIWRILQGLLVVKTKKNRSIDLLIVVSRARERK